LRRHCTVTSGRQEINTWILSREDEKEEGKEGKMGHPIFFIWINATAKKQLNFE